MFSKYNRPSKFKNILSKSNDQNVRLSVNYLLPKAYNTLNNFQLQSIRRMYFLFLLPPLLMVAHSLCTPPSFTPFTSISLNTPSLQQLEQSLQQYTLNQPDASSASGFFKPTLPYLIPLVVLSACSLALIVYIIWSNIKNNPVAKQQQSKRQRVCYLIILAGILLLGLGLIGLGIYNIILTKVNNSQIDYLNCKVEEAREGYYHGSDKNWMGSNHISSNISAVRISFVNNIKQLRNGLKGFTVNASNLGVPYSAALPTMKTYIDTMMTQWLTRNSSVAPTILAPICRTLPYTVPHPLDNTVTVSFPMMTTICNQLKKEISSFISNAESLDYLLSNYTSLMASIPIINSSLVSMVDNQTEFQLEVSSYDSDKLNIPYLSQYPSMNKVSYAASGISIGIGLICVILVSLILAKQSPQLTSKLSLITSILLFSLIIISSITCIYYLLQAIVFKYLAALYEYLPTPSLYQKLMTIYSFKQPMFSPFYRCITNPSSEFLSQDLTPLKTFTTLNQLYVNSTPPDLLESVSIDYTNLSTEYLGDLSKLSLSDGANLSNILAGVNLLANYNVSGSTQLPCNAALDQFYFNPLNCTSQILDPANLSQITIRQPRCIQIPSGERQSGSTRTSLNQVQNLYNISTAPCNSMANIFSNPSCFFQQRISTLFASSDCASKGSSLSTMIKNLVGFATAAGDVWDVYIQNLRNYIGAYLVFNTNITTFYTNNNVTQIFKSFSSPAQNVISNTSCGYINESASDIYDQLLKSVDYLLMVVVFSFSISIISCVTMVGVWETEKRARMENKIMNIDLEGENLERAISRRKSKNLDRLDNLNNLTLQNINDEVEGDGDVEIILETPKKEIKRRKRQKQENRPSSPISDSSNKRQNPSKRNSQPNVLNRIQENKDQQSINSHQFPIHPEEEFSKKGTHQKPGNSEDTDTITNPPIVYKSTLTRPGEFSSSSVKNIKNVILLDSNSKQSSENAEDSVEIDNLYQFGLVKPESKEEQSEKNSNQEGEEWVSATLSDHNNK